MRYIGGKSLMLERINEIVSNYTHEPQSFLDIFSGSGVVASFFKKAGFRVFSNDSLYFSYVINRGTLDLNTKPKFSTLGIEPIKYLNNLTLESSGYNLEQCFAYNNYSPNDNCSRMYFQPKNAIKIDIIRLKIQEWKDCGLITDDEYYYLLASLIAAIPYISNIAGVYGAYLKNWDVRTFKDLELKAPTIIKSDHNCTSYNQDANALAKNIYADIAYLDPPYNERQYLPNYHVLETIARYDYPVITGISGMRKYENLKSDFCKKNKASEALNDLIESLHSQYVIMSYNNEGIIPKEEIIKIFKEHGIQETFHFFEYEYRRYKSKKLNRTRVLKEQLFFIKKF